MRIHGLNRLSLVDYPGKMAAIVFTGGCNFRCPFCHNSSLVLDPDSQPLVPEQEVLSYLEKRRNMLDGLVITGGEPTLEGGLIPFMRAVRKLGLLVKLDTNGYRPDVLESVLEEGLADYVAMDIKNSPDAYARTAGLPYVDMERIRRSIDLIRTSGVDYEFRTTVVRGLHYRENFEKICALIAPCRRYFLQTFVPSQDTITEGWQAPDHDEMQSYVELIRTYIGTVQVRDSRD